jgi:hypothetical protein
MLVVTLPLAQILLPAMMATKSSNTDSRKFVFKSGAAMASVTTGGILGVALLSGFVCGGRWGVKLCDPSLLYVLLVSVVPLSVLRILVLFQFARHRDWLASWLVVPMLVYLYAVATSHWDARGLAVSFGLFSTASLVFFFLVHLATDRRTFVRK